MHVCLNVSETRNSRSKPQSLPFLQFVPPMKETFCIALPKDSKVSIF